jgi:hypothetical protein
MCILSQQNCGRLRNSDSRLRQRLLTGIKLSPEVSIWCITCTRCRIDNIQVVSFARDIEYSLVKRVLPATSCSFYLIIGSLMDGRLR